MAEPVTLDRHTSAVLIMDFQIRIVNNFASDPQGVVARAAQALRGARQAGVPVIYVVHRGGPFRHEASDVAIHPGVAPAPGETVVTKMKPGAFSTTGLDILLREMGVDTVILMGVATSTPSRRPVSLRQRSRNRFWGTGTGHQGEHLH